jgi:hypothetical protein
MSPFKFVLDLELRGEPDRSLIGDPAGQLATNLPALLRPGRRRSPAYLIVGETYFR